MKYHYFHRFFTYSVRQNACAVCSRVAAVTVFSYQARRVAFEIRAREVVWRVRSERIHLSRFVRVFAALVMRAVLSGAVLCSRAI